MTREPRTLLPAEEEPTVVEVRVAGFKSIVREQALEIRPLTILAGANSSGKSSVMQPLLLLKQTVEAAFDPGPLLLNGPNIRFTKANQLLSRTHSSKAVDSFRIGVRLTSGDAFETTFQRQRKNGFRVLQMEVTQRPEKFVLRPHMTENEILETGASLDRDRGKGHWEVQSDRCFLVRAWVPTRRDSPALYAGGFLPFVQHGIIPGLIHLPGLRGTPERTYPVAAVARNWFPGTFEQYTASVIHRWTDERNTEKLRLLNRSLRLLSLTERVSTRRLNDTEIEVLVGRLPRRSPDGKSDRVSIADVGIGVSQALPVLTALLAAWPTQLVYLEQPEVHLHPRAQVALARVLADAAERGVRVIAETHSSLLLLGIQSLVARGELARDKVGLHWFVRSRKTGATSIKSAELDEAGRFGNWPEDFDEVSLKAQSEYMDAADRRLFAQ
jgi:hypothetical protein